jgi:hypothetical protein
MSKLFLNTIIQHAGTISDRDAVTILNVVFKHINKKMKKIEQEHRIKFKLTQLPENNSDCIPMTVGLNTMVQVDGPLKGQIPMYTNVNIQLPTIEPVTTFVPTLNPFVPVVPVPGIEINPFGNTHSIKDRNKIGLKYLNIIKNIESSLIDLKNGKINKSQIDKQYFTFVDGDDGNSDSSDLIEKIKKNLDLTNISTGYSDL